MGIKVPVGGRYARVCGEVLDAGVRIAVRSYTHCPQTARMYYKPPATTTAPSSSCDGEKAASGGGADARSTKQVQQAAVAAKAVQMILRPRGVGSGSAARVHHVARIDGGGGKKEARHHSSR